MSDTDPVTQKLFEDVLDKVQQIHNDFTVIARHVEDYDQYGAQCQLECANGWCDWAWKLREEIHNRKMSLYKSIIKDGFTTDKGEKICIDNMTIHHWVFNFIK